MTDQERIEELIRQKEELRNQYKAISDELKYLKNKKIVCGRARYEIVRYATEREDEHRIVIQSKRKHERSTSIIIAKDREQAITDITSIIYDLKTLQNTLMGDNYDD